MNIYLRGLLPEMANLGWQIDVVSSWWQDQELDIPEPNCWGVESEPIHQRAPRGPEGKATRPVRVYRIGCRPSDTDWTRSVAEQRIHSFNSTVSERLDLGSYQSVSAHYWMSASSAQTLVPDKPMTLCYHTLQGNKSGRSIADQERMQAERNLGQAARAVVFNSMADLKRSAQWLKSGEPLPLSGIDATHRVIRPGLSAYFAPRPRPIARDYLAEHLGGGNLTGKLVVMAARQDPIKRVDLALEAIRKLRDKGVNVSLLVVGQRLPPENGIFSMETIPHEQMPWIFSASDLVLCPSDYESFGLTVLEACSSGVPVLVPEQSYWARIIEVSEAGRVVTGSRWAEAILQLLEDPLQSARSGLAGRVLSRAFSWKRAAKCWDRLIAS